MNDIQKTEPAAMPSAKPAARVHPDDRAKLAASNIVAKLSVGPPQEPPPTSYYVPFLIQCTLPHSDPKTRDWIKQNGTYTLIISSGLDRTGTAFGVPYGSLPRLVLAYIVTEVIRTRERRIHIGPYLSTWLHEIGYSGNHWGNGVNRQRIRHHLLRLLNASISFDPSTENKDRRKNFTVGPQFDLWWDFKRPDDGSLFGSWIEISQEFYNEILAAPVPLRTDILKELKKSPLAIDVYMWVSYRLFTMQTAGRQELTVSYASLQAQFGTGISTENYRKFL